MARETTSEKMFQVLDLIEQSAGPVAADEIQLRLGFTRSTLYRHLKILLESGLVTSMPNYGFSLGPRVTELDYRLRLRDPLVRIAKPMMVELAGSERGVALLCRRYQEKILCIHQERGAAEFQSNYERGLARPLFRGAASRIILAHLRGPQISRLHERFAGAFAEAGLGKTAAEARTALRQIRQRGWDITQGQVTAGVTGIAVPLLDVNQEVLASLSLTLGTPDVPAAARERLVARLSLYAAEIGRQLAAESPSAKA